MIAEDIVVYGAGGTSRDLLETLEAMNEDLTRWNIVGFIDDNPALAGETVFEYPVLGATAILGRDPLRRCKIAIGVGNDRNLFVRQKIRESILRLSPGGGNRFPTIIHPSATVSRRASLGEGATFLSNAFCSNNARIGSHALVLQGTVIGHDTILGDYVTMSANIAMGGGVRIRDGAYIGLGAVVYPGITIGRGSRVAMGAVVIRDVPDGETVSGNPARVFGVPGAGHACPSHAMAGLGPGQVEGNP
jgi:sugar O-acyltransferase (sialic acid O-acetyltransferase NeuD family)